MSRRDPKNRPAFTLIELIVVITLIALLAGIAAAFLPAIGDASRQATAGGMLQQWILIAKQKALRDQVPYGIRLLPYMDPATKQMVGYEDYTGQSRLTAPGQCRQIRFIEQPDDFAVSPSTFPTTTVATPPGTYPSISLSWDGINLVISNFLLSTRFQRTDFPPYSPPMYLEVAGNGLVYQISGFSDQDPKNPGKTLLFLASPQSSKPSAPFSNVKNFRLIRPARPTGDDVLSLPDGLMIDLSTNYFPQCSLNIPQQFRSPLPGFNSDGSIDILFSPSGAVLSAGVSDSINLWVRDFKESQNKNNAFKNIARPPDTTDGQQTIVAIYTRSGLTAAHPPAPMGGQNADPYAFIRDGRSSGK